ncbi:MAG: aminoglycoside phosphotransferase [Desulfobulbus propionicus]|nr:MAG: aminoglycoside phosphotransferase [Desulfobulbus propionicus]
MPLLPGWMVMIEAQTIRAKAAQLLEQQKSVPNGVPIIEQIVADGSTRSFIRLSFSDINVMCVLPPQDQSFGAAEAAAFYAIGLHLQQQQVPVPAIFGMDAETNMVVCEDLGDTRLHDLLVQENGMTQRVLKQYEQAVRMLARMQVQGGKAFRQQWCWDSPSYDIRLMVEKESGYFLRAFCEHYLHLGFNRAPVETECLHLAKKAAQAPSHFFLHRDFQSRNIMITDDKVRVIDFQGGSLGPLAYDLASLLIDPYAGLENKTQNTLVEVYLDELQQLIEYNPDQLRQELVTLSVQRNLQIIGAYAFLTKTRGKPFFKQFLKPALSTLLNLLEHPENNSYQALRALCKQCQVQLDKQDR